MKKMDFYRYWRNTGFQSFSPSLAVDEAIQHTRANGHQVFLVLAAI